MFFTAYSTTQIAQKTVHYVVALNVAGATAKFVGNHTDLEEDSNAVVLGSIVAGNLVANQTDKFTNPAVAKAAEYIQAHKPKINIRRKSQES